MTENHGLAKKPAFVAMNKGAVNAFNSGVVNPDKSRTCPKSSSKEARE
jgi:hypothetical protein